MIIGWDWGLLGVLIQQLDIGAINEIPRLPTEV